MGVFSRVTLRQVLTLPYLALVLLTAAVIGLLSYRAGSDAVDTLSHHLLRETVDRIAQAVEKHVSGSEAVLETAFPTGVAAPVSVQDELDELRMRFWLATSIHLDPNNYAYYGDRRGQFLGLWRFSETEAELRLRSESATRRSIYRYSGISGNLRDHDYEERIFDPRQRPWYKAGEHAPTQTWTSIYLDFKSSELVGTRARRVDNGAGDFEGVVATDLSLEHLTAFLRSLELSKNGFAYIAELDGNLIATSRGPHLGKGGPGERTRLNAADSDDPWIVATYRAISELTRKIDGPFPSRTGSFIGPDGGIVESGYSRLQDSAGLDWIVAVAVPRSDFMQGVTDNVYRTVWLAAVASLSIAGLGFLILNNIARDLRRLATAATDIGEGIDAPDLDMSRNDEIGELAKSFTQMQEKLLTDRLTGLANREAMIRRVETRIIRHRRRRDAGQFALLFVDLNNFKRINDQYGHPVGDNVLIEIGQRIRKRLRTRDLAGRIGGDEFMILLDDIAGRESAVRVREMMEQSLAQPLESLESLAGLGSGAMQHTDGAAIGIALFPDDGLDPETLVKQADVDMYRRKRIMAAAPPSPPR